MPGGHRGIRKQLAPMRGILFSDKAGSPWASARMWVHGTGPGQEASAQRSAVAPGAGWHPAAMSGFFVSFYLHRCEGGHWHLFANFKLTSSQVGDGF